MATMLPKVLEIERHQLADYARVDYAVTKGEDEVAALEELCLGPNELRREASVVCDRTVLAVREVRSNMAKRALTAKNMRGSLVEFAGFDDNPDWGSKSYLPCSLSLSGRPR